MAVKAVIYQVPDHHRSQVVCEAMSKGLTEHGVGHVVKYESAYEEVEAEVAIFYGLEGRLGRIFREYTRAAKAVYIDLGYWKRKESNDRFGGYHKIVVNDRHPTEYFQKRTHPGDRAESVGVKIEPWRDYTSGHILIAGMGDKGARAEGFEVEEFERKVWKRLSEFTDRRIVYRPKPSYRRARPIQGLAYSPRTIDISVALQNCFAVVTHHSNVAVDAICRGIPAFSWKGVAVKMSQQELAYIECPSMPDGREQWVNDLAYCQWNVEEMKKGLAWNYLVEEGLV
jgi:hypothetical protein